MYSLRFLSVVALSAGCTESVETAPAERDVTYSQRTLSPGCVGSGYVTIQSAINAAVNDDVIEICAGTYNERLTITGKRLTLRSLSGAALTTIDAGGTGRGLNITGGADVIVDGLTFRNGSTTGSGANLSCTTSDLELRNSVLTAGVANKGGGVSSTDCIGTIEDNTVEANSATLYGGGVYVKGNAMLVQRNWIIGNHTDSTGGGLYLSGSSDLVDNTFEGNDANLYGGGAFVTLGYGDILGNTVVGNSSVNDGGGIYVDRGKPLVDGNTFDYNTSGDEGGGLRVKVSEAVISYNTFTGNFANWRGGGLKVSHDEVTMTGNTYIDNDAGSYGGGSYLYESASVITHEDYVGNDAEYGGSMGIEAGWGNVLVEDCTFESSHTSYKGGVLFIKLPTRTTTLRRVGITGGKATYGGAIYAETSVISFENLVLDDNLATTSGGAVYLDGVSGKVRNSVIYDNTAPAGSGIQIVNGVAGLSVSNDVLYQNLTSAALSVASGTVPTVKYSDFNGNTADFSGMASVIGATGNIATAPMFVDPVNGDFALQVGSPLVNTGDPALLDPNGTRSDIGRFGGPKAF